MVLKTIPSKIPESLEVDISSLEEAGDVLHVSDITMPADVELVTDAEGVVCRIEAPRAAVEEEAEEGAEDAADVPSEHGGDSDEAEAAGEKAE